MLAELYMHTLKPGPVLLMNKRTNASYLDGYALLYAIDTNRSHESNVICCPKPTWRSRPFTMASSPQGQQV